MPNELIIKNMVTTVLNAYTREAAIGNVDNMHKLSQPLLSIVNELSTHFSHIADVMTECYRSQSNAAIRSHIVNFLTQIKNAIQDPAVNKLPLEKALAECAEFAIDSKQDKKSSIVQLTNAVNSFAGYAKKIEGELSEVYEKKYTDALLLRAEAYQGEGESDSALNDYKLAYQVSNSEKALSQMAFIETELGFYEEAIRHYRIFSEIVFSGQEFILFQTALDNLKKMHEEMVEGDSRREEIILIMQKMLATIFENYPQQINTLSKVAQFENYLKIVTNPSLAKQLQAINDAITPLEKERLNNEKKEEDRMRYIQKQLEGKGRSSELQLSTLLNLYETEKHNEKALSMINTALKNWIESVARVDEGRVSIRNESGMIQLVKKGNLLATFYLAKFYEQRNNLQVALSLYARIAMSPVNDKEDETLKNNARRSIENFANQSSNTLTRFFLKDYAQFAADLLSVINKPSSIPDPDGAIQAGLHEKMSPLKGAPSLNGYILGITAALGDKAEAPKPAAMVYRRPSAGKNSDI